MSRMQHSFRQRSTVHAVVCIAQISPNLYSLLLRVLKMGFWFIATIPNLAIAATDDWTGIVDRTDQKFCESIAEGVLKDKTVRYDFNVPKQEVRFRDLDISGLQFDQDAEARLRHWFAGRTGQSQFVRIFELDLNGDGLSDRALSVIGGTLVCEQIRLFLSNGVGSRSAQMLPRRTNEFQDEGAFCSTSRFGFVKYDERIYSVLSDSRLIDGIYVYRFARTQDRSIEVPVCKVDIRSEVARVSPECSHPACNAIARIARDFVESNGSYIKTKVLEGRVFKDPYDDMESGSEESLEENSATVVAERAVEPVPYPEVFPGAHLPYDNIQPGVDPTEVQEVDFDNDGTAEIIAGGPWDSRRCTPPTYKFLRIDDRGRYVEFVPKQAFRGFNQIEDCFRTGEGMFFLRVAEKNYTITHQAIVRGALFSVFLVESGTVQFIGRVVFEYPMSISVQRIYN